MPSWAQDRRSAVASAPVVGRVLVDDEVRAVILPTGPHRPRLRPAGPQHRCDHLEYLGSHVQIVLSKVLSCLKPHAALSQLGRFVEYTSLTKRGHAAELLGQLLRDDGHPRVPAQPGPALRDGPR